MRNKARVPDYQDNKETIHFGLSVPANTASDLQFHVPYAATIDRLRVRIYAGAQLTLQIKPIVRRLSNQTENIVKYAQNGKKFLDGDDDVFDFGVSIPIFEDEDIIIEYKNTDLINAYDFAVDVELDYKNGQYRI